jgi:hypothetical protein
VEGPVNRLTVNSFIVGNRDFETQQYLVLDSLKGYYDDYAHNRLYPSLAELIELCGVLETLVQKKGDIESHLPQQLQQLDLVNQKLVYAPLEGNDADFERAVDLIIWALPHLKKAINEGTDIYNFVDEHLVIEEVGILPVYRDEGYWFVPDARASRLHLFRFEVSLFTSAHEQYRTLKTRLLESIEEIRVRHSPESLKLGLIEKYRDLPNPATFICNTDLDFPYAETLLPVAKRKLMKQLCS